VTRHRLPALYAIVDPLDTGIDPVHLGDAMLAGGARLLQLRLKDADTSTGLAVARTLREHTRRLGALLLVNDRPDLARACAADGVHLGQDDLPLAAARRILPPPAIIGISTHDDDELAAAIAAGPDYVAVGPIFGTTSKVAALPSRGLESVRTARQRTSLPLVAIGGITPDTAAMVRWAGADSVAMIGALVRAPDVAAATRAAVAALRPPP
jgi:thiamine-phosphate pyrophosphorylase